MKGGARARNEAKQGGNGEGLPSAQVSSLCSQAFWETEAAGVSLLGAEKGQRVEEERGVNKRARNRTVMIVVMTMVVVIKMDAKGPESGLLITSSGFSIKGGIRKDTASRDSSGANTSFFPIPESHNAMEHLGCLHTVSNTGKKH